MRVFASQSGGKQPPQDDGDQKDARRKAEMNLLLSLLVSYPAARGSLAVAAGYLAHIDPLGTLKWDSHDALVGCLFAILPSIIDLIIIGPNWEPKRTTRTMKHMVPRSVAEKVKLNDNTTIIKPISTSASAESTSASTAESSTSSSSTLTEKIATLQAGSVDEAVDTLRAAATAVATAPPSDDQSPKEEGDPSSNPPSAPDMVEIERVMNVRAQQHPLRDALLSIQMSRVMSNLGRALSPPSEALLLTLVHISEEMLYRGVVLTLVVKWCTDNLYYAGIDEVITLPGGLDLAVPQLGAILGGVTLTTGAVGLLVQRELFPLRLLETAKEQLQAMVDERKEQQKKGKTAATAEKKEGAEEAEESKKDKADSKKKFVLGMIDRLKSGVVVQQRWIVAVEAMVEFTQWSSLSASYLITGNILAPIVGSMANDIVYSIAQRMKHRQIKAIMDERAKSSAERAKRTTDLLTAVREHRKNRLQPPPKGMGLDVKLGNKEKSDENGAGSSGHESNGSNGNDKNEG